MGRLTVIVLFFLRIYEAQKAAGCQLKPRKTAGPGASGPQLTGEAGLGARLAPGSVRRCWVSGLCGGEGEAMAQWWLWEDPEGPSIGPSPGQAVGSSLGSSLWLEPAGRGHCSEPRPRSIPGRPLRSVLAWLCQAHPVRAPPLQWGR